MNMNTTILGGPVTAMLLVAGFSTNALASVVPLGSTIILPTGTSYAARPELGGTTLQDVRQTFSLPNSVSGWIESTVVKESSTGTLDFYNRIHNNATSVFSISQVDFENFGHPAAFPSIEFSTDVDWRNDSGGAIRPYSATRSPDGSMVSFIYGHIYPDRLPLLDIHGGETTFSSFIKTNATNYDNNGSVTLWSQGLVPNWYNITLNTFQPISVVPEPDVSVMFVIGVALVGWASRRQQARVS